MEKKLNERIIILPLVEVVVVVLVVIEFVFVVVVIAESVKTVLGTIVS